MADQHQYERIPRVHFVVGQEPEVLQQSVFQEMAFIEKEQRLFALFLVESVHSGADLAQKSGPQPGRGEP